MPDLVAVPVAVAPPDGGAEKVTVGSAESQEGSAPERPAERKPAPAPVLDSEARRELVEQASGKSSRQVMQLLAEMDPELAAQADRARPPGGGRWELKAVIDDECRRGLERLKGLLSHVDPHLTMGQLMGRLVREGLDRHDPARRAGGAPRRPKAPSRLRRRRRRRPRLAALPRQRSRRAARDSAAPSAAKVSAQAAAQPGDEAADRPHTSAVNPAGDTTRRRRRGAPAGRLRRPARSRLPRRGPNFDGEGGWRDRPRYPGGGQARGVAARPGPLPLGDRFVAVRRLCYGVPGAVWKSRPAGERSTVIREPSVSSPPISSLASGFCTCC